MGKQKYITPVTPFAEVRDTYNSTHNKMVSQAEMASLAFVSKSTISRIENGEQKATPTVIKAYSDYFKVSTDYFMPKEEIQNKIPDEAIPICEMGITEEVFATYKQIEEISNHNENILAVLNSLIGNGIYTVNFLQNIFTYLVSQQSKAVDEITKAVFVKNMLDYMNNIMKPQLDKVLRHNIDWQGDICENKDLKDK